MRTFWPLLCAAIPLAISVSGCSNAYETFGPPAKAAETKSCPAKQPPKKKAARVKAVQATSCEATKVEKKDKPEPLGACITFQFMGGADCEDLTKRKCYDNHMNVADWRSGVACWKAGRRNSSDGVVREAPSAYALLALPA